MLKCHLWFFCSLGVSGWVDHLSPGEPWEMIWSYQQDLPLGLVLGSAKSLASAWTLAPLLTVWVGKLLNLSHFKDNDSTYLIGLWKLNEIMLIKQLPGHLIYSPFQLLSPLHVLVHSSCYNKKYRGLGGLNNKHLLFTVWRLGSPRSRCQ